MSPFKTSGPAVRLFLRYSGSTGESPIEAVLVASFLVNAIIVGFFTISRELGSSLATIGV